MAVDGINEVLFERVDRQTELGLLNGHFLALGFRYYFLFLSLLKYPEIKCYDPICIKLSMSSTHPFCLDKSINLWDYQSICQA